MAVLWVAAGVLYLAQGRFGLGAVHLGAAALAGCVLASAPLRVEADGNGMRVVWPLRSTYLSWDRIVEVRGNAGRWSEYLVVVRPDGSLVRLPPGLPQDVVDGWRPPSGTTSVQASPP